MFFIQEKITSPNPEIKRNETTPSNTGSFVRISSVEILGKLQTKKYKFDEFSPEFSTNALEAFFQNDNNVCYDNTTQVTEEIPHTTLDESNGNVPQKVSQVDMLANELTMGIAAIVESVVDVATDTPSSEDCPSSSKSDANIVQDLQQKSEISSSATGT